MRGISDIRDKGAWREATAAHVERYFNGDDDANDGLGSGAYNVTVNILIYQDDRQRSRERRRLRGDGWSMRGTKGVDDGESYARIVYRQRSAYRTSDPTTYDEAYVAMDPFLSWEARDMYISSLRALSSDYDGVESVGVRFAPSPDAHASMADGTKGDDDGGGDMSRNTIYIIVGSACGGAILLAALALFAYRRGRNDKEYMSPVGNGPSSSMRRFDGDSESRDLGDDGVRADPGGPPATANVVLNVIIPPGKLGIVLETPPAGGCAYVCKIKDACPVKDEIRLEDRIIAVDNEDVQTMNAVKLSKMLSRRSGNATRTITILRVATAEPDAKAGGDFLADDPALLGALPSPRCTPPPTPNDYTADGSAAASTRNGTGQTIIDVVAPPGKLDFLADDPALLGALPSPRCTPPPTSNDYTADGSAAASTRNGTGQTIIDVVAPPGKLGVVLLDPEPHEPPGPAFVCKICTDSPLADKVKLGDKILAVDDWDVGKMSAEDVSKLLGSKKTNLRRNITLLRENSSDGGTKRESADAASPAAKPADNAVAIRAEIITLCAALQFPRSTEEMLSSYEGREYELLKNLRNMKKMRSNQNTAGGQKNDKGLVNPENSETTVRTGTRIDIMAPPGKLGIVVDSPRDGGLPYVSHIKEYCPIREEIRLGDKLVRINDEDVTKLKGFHISSESLCDWLYFLAVVCMC
ncbi:hypothetical protein ACHAW5_004459 [Stephanodiscus triporus]|uniref:PDZ domain-containing protein n=1 Tax=Stephanodiscus triporus TaxID=2934178 RepID=A0ABD3QBD7_9STRA